MKQKLLSILIVLSVIAIITVLLRTTYEMGISVGYNRAKVQAQKELDDIVEMVKKGAISYKRVEQTPLPKTPNPVRTTAPQPVANWNGPQLWDEVNRRRVQLGVNSLSQKDELCTIASIRLNELLALGKLDGHEGFSSLPDRRSDLKWIYEKYNLSEFLLSGAQSPQEAVSLWENTLGHKKLLTGGEYVWGCIYAQNTFAVAIAAY